MVYFASCSAANRQCVEHGWLRCLACGVGLKISCKESGMLQTLAKEYSRSLTLGASILLSSLVVVGSLYASDSF